MANKLVDRLRAVVADAERSFGPDDPRTLDARFELGLGFRDRGHDADAHAELAAVAGARARALGPDHPDTLTARHQAALSLLHVHMCDVTPDPAVLPEAIRGLESVGADRVRVLGPDHPDTLDLWLNLGFAYEQADRTAEAETVQARILPGWERVVANLEATVGPDDPETQFRRLRLAHIYQTHGRREDARAVRENVLGSWGRVAADRAARLGPVDPDTVEAREHHAWAHGTVDRPDDEVRLWREIVADHERLLGPSDARTLRAQVGFAWANHELPESVALAEQIIDEVAAKLTADDLSKIRNVLVLHLARTGRPGEAPALAARYPVPSDELDDDY